MALRFSKKLLHKIVDAEDRAKIVAEDLDGATFLIYSGTQPKTTDTPHTDDVVVDFGPVRFKQKGERAVGCTPWHGTAKSSEPVGWFRLQNATAVVDGTVSAAYGTADLHLMNAPMLSSVVCIDNFVIDCSNFN